MSETRIDDVPGLSQFLVALKSLGYRTTDQLIGAHRVSGDLLAKYLKTDATKLQGLIDKIPRREQVRSFAAVPQRRFTLGARLDRISRPTHVLRMSAVSAVPLPPKVNMISDMPPIRDQGDRGTCVAHACLAVLEHYLKFQNKYEDMSEQFLYWNCKQKDGDPNESGTWINVAMPLLQSDGCCREITWPYNPTIINGNESQGPPPPAALVEAPQCKVGTIHQIAATSIIDIKSELAQKRCVAFSIPVYNSWYQNQEVQRTGEIINPIPNEEEINGHAMCFVGYEDIPDELDLGGGKFFIRNSWNSYWATESVLGSAGYGTIPYSYITRFGTEAYSIE
jgi:C1A family cysteine protease